MTNNANVYAAHNWYVASFKRWADKLCGPKPTEAELNLAHVVGKPGKQSLALAMALRPSGMSGTQMMYACGGKPQNNHRRDLITAGFFKRIPASGPEGETVYKIELTAKGQKRVEMAAKKAADLETAGKVEPGKTGKAKPKAKGKASKPAKGPSKPASAPKAPKAPKVPQPQTLTSDAPSAIEGQPANDTANPETQS